MSTMPHLPECVMKEIMEYADLNTSVIAADLEELARMCDVYKERKCAEAIEASVAHRALTTKNFEATKRYLYWDSATVCANYGMLLRASLYTYAMQMYTDAANRPPFIFEDDNGAVHEFEVTVDPVVVHDNAIMPRVFMGRTMPNPNLDCHRVVEVYLLEHPDLTPRERLAEIRRRRVFSLELKAHLMFLLLSQQLAFAQASDGINKYVALLTCLWEVVVRAVLVCVGWCGSVYNSVSLEWYYQLDPAVSAAVDLAALCGLCVGYYCAQRPMRIAPSAKKNGCTRFLGQIANEKGIFYRVEIDGKIYELGADHTRATYTEEMAMPGSEYFPCKSKPIGAIMVANSANDLRTFGVFWRLDNVFVTARHCAYALNETTSNVYLCSIRETKHSNFEIDTSRAYSAPDGFFDPIHNLIGPLNVDVYARDVSDADWAKIRVQKASGKLPSLYDQQVQTAGFTENGLLVAASGKTLKGSGLELLHHTASTRKGFSGSPLFCGNSVVGMHVAADGTHNVAVRRELIEYLIGETCKQEAKRGYFTYADAAYKERYARHKWRGGLYSVARYGRDGSYAIELKNGECTYGWTMNQMAEAFGPYTSLEKNLDYVEDMLYENNKRSYGGMVQFDDENASIHSEEHMWEECGRGKPVHTPKAPLKQPEIVQAIEDVMEEVVACGYDPTVYQYPEMNAETERKSLFAHLSIAEQAKVRESCAPTCAEIERCAQIVAEQLNGAQFMPDPDYNQLSGVLRVINSSIVDVKKSPGFPYLENNQSTNGQVLKHYGESGFAQHVLNEWDSEFVLRWFLKAEPNKAKKIAQDRPRGLAGFPLHKLVKHASIFMNFNQALVENWRELPVKVGYSPGNPGSIANLKKTVPGKTWSSDKETWDFTMQEWHFLVLERVICLLAVKPEGMTDEAFAHYLQVDVPNAVREVYRDSVYQISDGTRYKVHKRGIMKSGCIITLSANSVSQLVHNAMVLMRLGYDDDSILKKRIFAGGDDVEQEPAHHDKKEYCDQSAILGVRMSIEERPDLEHSEFFSADLRRDEQGRWQFYPQRFTKHIENLLRIKKENLASALANYMGDHRHDERKYNLFLSLFHKLRRGNPGLFPLCYVKSRQALLASQYGYN